MTARLPARLRTEHGFVLITVMLLLMITMLLGIAALAATQASSIATARSGKVRRAQQAADAGVQSQLYQQSENRITNAGSSYDLNGGLLSLSNFLDCIEPQFSLSLTVTGLINTNVNSAGVCPVNGSPGVNGGGFVPISLGHRAYAQSEFIPGATTALRGASEVDLAPKIVSLGWTGSSSPSTSGNVFSRVEAILAPLSPLPVLGADGNLTVGGVQISGGLLGTVLGLLGLSNLATTVNGDIQSANNITLPSIDASLNLTLKNGLLGVAKLGGTLSPSNGIAIAQVVHTAPPVREPVTIASPGVKPSCPAADVTVPRQANCADFASFYNASTDSVNVPAGQTITIPAGDYVFCNFTAAGTVVAKPTSAAPVRIMIDAPNSTRCKGNNPTLANNATFNHAEWSEGNFQALNGVENGVGNVPGVLGPSGVQVYVAGDKASNPYDDNTFVEIGTPGLAGNGGLLSTNQATESMVVYAPTSEVSMTTATCVNVPLVGNVCVPGVFTGNLIGDDVSATALTFTQDLDLGNFPLYNGLNVYHVRQYVQCSPLPTDSSGNKYTSLQGNQATDTNGC